MRANPFPVKIAASPLMSFGPGWRMYYVQRGAVLILMLGGGDKSTQQADIAAAQALARHIEDGS